LIKIVISVIVILAVAAIAKKLPSIAGLIAAMPPTGALVLVWIYLESNGDPSIMQDFAKSALWGILPSMLFLLLPSSASKEIFLCPWSLFQALASGLSQRLSILS